MSRFESLDVSKIDDKLINHLSLEILFRKKFNEIVFFFTGYIFAYLSIK